MALILLGMVSCAGPDGSLSLRDPAGASHAPLNGAEHGVVLLFFLGTECPVSNAYAPDMHRIAEAGMQMGVATYGVYPEPEAAPAAAARHAGENSLGFTILLDPDQALANRMGITRVPTAVVIAPGGKIAYRGRIDDRYSMAGKRRSIPRTRDLEDALEAILAGALPAVRETPAFGCLLLRPVEHPGE